MVNALHRELLSYGCTQETSWQDCKAHKNSRNSLFDVISVLNGNMQHARANLISRIFQLRYNCFQPLVSDHRDAFSDLHVTQNMIRRTLVTIWNYTCRNFDIACNKLSSIKQMCQDLFSEEAPGGSVLVRDQSVFTFWEVRL